MNNFRRACTLVAALLPIALASFAPNAVSGEASALAAFPAALHSTCAANCADTLHAKHTLTFISRLSFPEGSAMLTRDAKNEFARLLAELEAYAVIHRVEIVGHADPSGPESYNRWLSQLRAERVRDHFAQSGVDPRRMAPRGAGSAEPLPGAIDPAEHRRIEIHITLQPFL